MLDIKFVRNNPDAVKQNIKNKFQDEKLPLVDEVLELDQKNRDIKKEVEALRAEKNKISKEIGALMAQGKKEEASVLKQKVAENADRMEALSAEEKEVEENIRKIMMIIPNIIDPSVPIGKDDSENVEVERYGEPFVPDFEIPYHTEIMERFNGIDLDSARRVAGNGFYYLMGDIARLHSSVISYARDFMIDRGFTYCVPPFMIRSNVDVYKRQNYSRTMRQVIQSQKNLDIRQMEVTDILAEEGRVTGVQTYSGAIYRCRAVVLCTGTYLKARCIYGDISTYTGPNGLQICV